MSQNTQNVDKADRLMTALSGWASLVLGVFTIHRALLLWTLWSDWWTRAGLILSVGLGLMWLWGYWPDIVARFRGWSRSGGWNSAAVAVGLVLGLIIINALVIRRAEVKFDLTKNQRFTLAPRTREILKGIKEPIKAEVFLPGGRGSEQAKDLFQQYADASPKFTWTVINPLTNPEKFLSKDVKLSPELRGARIEYAGKHQDITDFTEKEITAALLKMTRDTERKILFLKGHGEASADASAMGVSANKAIQVLLEDLRASQWKVENVDLYGKNATAPDPATTAVLVIAGPDRELAADEQKRINEYLDKGGKVLLLLSVQGPPMSAFLKPWGIQTTNDLVVDPARGAILFSPEPSAHASVKPAQRAVFFQARSVKPITPAPTGITVTELIKSGSTSQIIENFVAGKTDAEAALAGAKPGPATIAALAEKTIGSGDTAKTARLLVVGDATFTTDQLTRIQGVDNIALSSGLVNYLGEEEALVSIPPKDENTEQAFVDEGQQRLFNLIHLADFPLLALALAIFVYWKRR